MGQERAGRPLRPAPHDFADRCAVLTQNQLCAVYGCGSPIIKRWCAEGGLTPVPDPRGRQDIPDDLAERARDMYQSQLARHYGITETKLRRMLRVAGIEAARYDQRTPKPGQNRNGSYHRASIALKRSMVGINHLRRDTSLEGMAADHLRRFCAVYRCTETGRADQAGSHWRYGAAVLTPADMIARAERNGFEPDAWRRIAA